MQYRAIHFLRFGKAALAALLVGMVLLLNAMAACPALHELFHKDADEPDHHCVVTLFAHGQVETTTCDVPVVIPVVSVEIRPQTGFSFSSSAIEDLPPGRAPPASCTAS